MAMSTGGRCWDRDWSAATSLASAAKERKKRTVETRLWSAASSLCVEADCQPLTYIKSVSIFQLWLASMLQLLLQSPTSAPNYCHKLAT